MLLTIGERYRRTDIQKGIKRTNRLGAVRIDSEYFVSRDDSGRWYIALNAADAAKSSVDGLIAVGKSNNGKIDVGGELKFYLRNLWGGNRSIIFEWKEINEISSLRLNVEDPHLPGIFLGAYMSFYEENKLYYKNRDFSLGLVYPLSFVTSISSGIRLRWVMPDSLGMWVNNIPKEKSIGFDIRSLYNTLDDEIFPKSGLKSELSISGLRTEKTAPDGIFDDDLLDDEYSIEGFLKGTSIKYWGLYGLYCRFYMGGDFFSTDNNVILSDLSYLGGFNSVRGHFENEIWGEHSFYVNVENRVLLGEGSAGFLFYDLGGVYSDKKSSQNFHNSRKNIHGYGIGFISRSNFGLLSVSYGISSERSINDGLIHFGIRREF